LILFFKNKKIKDQKIKINIFGKIIPLIVIDDYINVLFLLLSGFGSGIYVGIASGTAEAFMIPAIAIFVGGTIYQAIGTSLIVDCIIGGVAGFIFLKKGNAKIKPVIYLLIAGIIGSLIGSNFTSDAPEKFLQILLALILILVGFNLIINGVNKNVIFIESKINFNLLKKNKFISFIILGLIIGFASGFSGMGSSGAVTLVLIFIMGYDLHTSIGTSLLMMFFIAGSGALIHGIIYENILLDVVLIAGFGAIIGASSGSIIANKINEDLLSRLIGIIIVILGFIILFKFFIA
jgi:uncharacterized membrane protein YfcA